MAIRKSYAGATFLQCAVKNMYLSLSIDMGCINSVNGKDNVKLITPAHLTPKLSTSRASFIAHFN